MDNKTRKMLLDAWNGGIRNYRVMVYGVITPRKNGEFTLTCYGMKETKRDGIQITAVNRAWSDRPYYQAKDIWKNWWGATMIEFNERRNRKQESYGWYGGKWGSKISWNNGDDWFMKYITYINIDALQGTKYKWCAYRQYSGDMSLVQYVRLYGKHKEIEILAKNGLSRFVESRFLDRMAKDKPFRDFFRQNCKELAWNKYRPYDVIRAFKNRWTIDKAWNEEYIRYTYNRIPNGIDKHELHKYLGANNIQLHDWYGYADDVAEARMDIRNCAFPRDFHAKRKEVMKEIERLQSIADAELEAKQREVAKRIDTLLRKIKNRLAWKMNDYEIIIPTTRAQFEAEGREMHNCIGGYFTRCAKGETMCFFIHKDGEVFTDVECDPKTGRIRQCYMKRNTTPDEETKLMASDLAKRFARNLRKERKAA